MHTKRIVVGMDARPQSRAALAWAAAEACERGAELTVVHARDPASAQAAPYAPSLGRSEAHRRLTSDQQSSDEAVSAVEERYPRLRVRRHLGFGSPARELLNHSQGAELLVLGASAPRGRERHLGPVLLACLRHARCPVVVVGDDDSQQSAPGAAAGRPDELPYDPADRGLSATVTRRPRGM